MDDVIEAKLTKVSDREIQELRNKIEEQKRIQEYQNLKKDLEEISYRSANSLNEFDSAMQSPDTDRVLQSRKGKDHFINLAIKRFQHMLSPRPAVGNFIALALIISVIVLLRGNFIQKIDGYDVHKILPYLGYGALVAGALQIIKSATRTLLIPLLAIVIGGIVAVGMGQHDIVMTFGKDVYQGMFVCGLIGFLIAGFAID